jgi:hypothetical protein
MIQAVVMEMDKVVVGGIDGVYELLGVLGVRLGILGSLTNWIYDYDLVALSEFLVVFPDQNLGCAPAWRRNG